MKRPLTILLLLIILVVMFVPFVQGVFKVADTDERLGGYFVPKTDTVFTWENWFSRAYQDKMDPYLNENFGFRRKFVRLNNQAGYSLFGEINVWDVFAGRKNYLFSRKFFNNFSGVDYKGQKHVDSVFAQIQMLNDSLKAKNKKLLVCFLPCKESYYTEYLPLKDIMKIRGENYYGAYSRKFAGSNIPLLDYHLYFRKMKGKEEHPIFTQGAVHITTYANYLALDTLLKRVASELQKNVNQIKITSVEESSEPRFADDDVAQTMNLLVDLNSEKLAYPKVVRTMDDKKAYKPKVMVIGDSFYYGLFNTWIPFAVFSDESYFLYYFKQAISNGVTKPTQMVANMDLKKEMKNTEMVILFFSIANFDQFPYDANSLVQHLN